jgi:hypothetical protein
LTQALASIAERDPNSRIQQAALNLLGRWGATARDAAPNIKRVLESTTNPDVRETATRSLKDIEKG